MAKQSRKELLARLRHRVHHGGKAVASGAKGTLFAGGAGGAIGYVVNMDAVNNIQFVKDHWWVKGAAIIAGGHFLKRKPALQGVGLGLCGAGGYALAQAYQMQSSAPSEGAGDVSDRVFGRAGNAGALQEPGAGYGPVALPMPTVSGLGDSQTDAGALQSDADTLSA